jgi:hypothetical protein
MTAKKILVGASMLLWIVGCGSTPNATLVDAGVSTTVDLNAPVNPDNAVLGPDSPVGEIQFPVVFQTASLHATVSAPPPSEFRNDSSSDTMIGFKLTVSGVVEPNPDFPSPLENLAEDYIVCMSVPIFNLASFIVLSQDFTFGFDVDVLVPTSFNPATDVSLWVARDKVGCAFMPNLSGWSTRLPLVQE